MVGEKYLTINLITESVDLNSTANLQNHITELVDESVDGLCEVNV